VRTVGLFAALGFLFGSIARAQVDRVRDPIQTSRSIPLRRHVHPHAQMKYDVGPVDPAFAMRYITLVLKPAETARVELDRLIESQQDPASPGFRKWLTPEQYADRFGASQRDIEKISAWLKHEGFRVEATARGRDWIAFSGTASSVEAAFGAAVHRYEWDGESHFAISAEPSIPAALEPVVEALLGLDDFPKSSQPTRPAITLSNGLITLAPDDLRTIYGVQRLHQAGIDGTGQKIAVLGQTAVDLADIQAFRKTYGMIDAAVQLVQTGPDPGMNPNFLGEADLDLEWSGAMAPNATLLYVYSKDLNQAVLHAIDQNLAPVLSESFGICEEFVSAAQSSAYELEAKKANAMGITWVVATGDSGAANCDRPSPFAAQGLAVSFPSNLPEVTAVGGTEFNEGTGADAFWAATNGANGESALSYVPEMAWNDTAYLGYMSSGGGGVSKVFSKPSWQSGPGVPNDGARDLPDVAMDAGNGHDPYNIVSGGQLMGVGGTSAAAPVFAGIVALLNESLAAGGAGNINPDLYRLAQSTPGIFHDIVAGNNIVPCEPESPDCANGQFGYSAGPGYDLATGLGSVDAYNLVMEWNGTAAGTPSITSVTPASATAGGASFQLTVNGSNFGAGSQVQWNGASLPTTVASATQLQVQVDASLIAIPGIAAVTVSLGGKASATFYFTVSASESMGLSYSNQRVTASPPSACTPPAAMNSFVTTDGTIYLWFQATITANDRLVISWLAPDNSVYLTVYPGLQPGKNYCGLSTSFNIASLPSNQLGAWQVRLYDNSTELFSLPFTVSTPGAVTPSIGSLVNGASFQRGGPVAPGSLATIFGTGFAPQVYASSIPLPVMLAGVTVKINQRPAPIVFINPTQINFEIPLETPAGAATAIVETNGVPSAVFSFQVQSVNPGLFAALNNADGSANGTAHPASPGDFLVVYMTGQGPVSQPEMDGVPTPAPPPLFNALKPYSATIGTAKANVTFLGLSPGFVGLAQADVQIPKLAAGTYPLTITVGGVTSNSLSISVK